MVKGCMIAIFSLLSSFAMSQCLKADIIFMLDWSGSEDSNRVYIPSAAMAFLDDINLGPSSVKIGVIPFDEEPIISRCLYPSYDKAMLQEVFLSLMGTQPSGRTSFMNSFHLARTLFDRSEKERGEPVLRILIFISDGDENGDFDREGSIIAADGLKSSGAYIWCIATPTSDGTRPSRERMHMQRICSKPPEVFYIEENYYGLKEELSRLDVCP